MALSNSNFGRNSIFSGMSTGNGLEQQMAQGQAQGMRSIQEILNGVMSRVNQQKSQQNTKPSLLDGMGIAGSEAFHNKSDPQSYKDGATGLQDQEWWQKKNPQEFANFQAAQKQIEENNTKPQGAFGPAPQTAAAPTVNAPAAPGQSPVGAFGNAPKPNGAFTPSNPETAINNAIANPVSDPYITGPDQQINSILSNGIPKESPEFSQMMNANATTPEQRTQAQGIASAIGVPQNITNLMQAPQKAISAANDAFTGKLDIAGQNAVNPNALQTLRDHGAGKIADFLEQMINSRKRIM